LDGDLPVCGIVGMAPFPGDDAIGVPAPRLAPEEGVVVGAGLDHTAKAWLLDALSLSAVDAWFADAATALGDGLAG
jgi:hypothetical protein